MGLELGLGNTRAGLSCLETEVPIRFLLRDVNFLPVTMPAAIHGTALAQRLVARFSSSMWFLFD
jgi:hypothetical protein